MLKRHKNMNMKNPWSELKTANSVEKMNEAVFVIVRAPNSQVSPKRHKIHHSFKTITKFSHVFFDFEPFLLSIVRCL